MQGRRGQNSAGHTKGYSETLRRRSYEWDVNDRLKKVANGLTKGVIMFSYDQFSNLVRAEESGVETIFRETDSVGNLYETPDKSNRVYGAGNIPMMKKETWQGRQKRMAISLLWKRNAQRSHPTGSEQCLF